MYTLTEQQRKDILQYKHLQPAFTNQLIQLNRKIRSKITQVFQQHYYLLLIKEFYDIEALTDKLQEEYEDLVHQSKENMLKIEETWRTMNDQTASLNRLKYLSEKQLAGEFNFTILKAKQIEKQIGNCVRKEVKYFQARKSQPQFQYCHIPVSAVQWIIRQRYQQYLDMIWILDLHEAKRKLETLQII